MKSRPILMSAPMVRALLAGRKTQTRRVVKSVELARGEARGVRVAPSTFCYLDFDGVPGLSWRPFAGSPTVPYPPEKIVEASPYGKPGDTLWVKETWLERLDHVRGVVDPNAVRYVADGEPPEPHRWRKRSPIHMPRWASRITLEVTGVRVERLQAISEEDAKADGVEPIGERWRDYLSDVAPLASFSKASNSFWSLWGSINGADSWAANPWVWAISFRVVTP